MAVLATAVWRVRPSGVNTNGGGYDPGISGAATDYSQQNAAQATGANGATTGAGATTFTDATAGAFTSAMVGNCIQIASGTNFQVGFYFVTAFTNANSVVLDRTPTSGGAGSAGVWKLGGGWADFITNTTSTGPLVPGNTVYILGSGTPNPAAYTYDYTVGSAITFANGNGTVGRIFFANDPATPGYKMPPDTTGGMPVVKITVNNAFTVDYHRFNGLWLVAGTGIATNNAMIAAGTHDFTFFGCVSDQFGFDVYTIGTGLSISIGCEFFSSVGAASGGVTGAISMDQSQPGLVYGCNIHDMISNGLIIGFTGTISNCIIANCGNVGIKGQNSLNTIINNTIDGNKSHGIEITTQASVVLSQIFNNIISNHTGGGKFGLIIDAGSAAANTLLVAIADYNTYYNNTASYSGINAGLHDTALGSNPYVAQSTENYQLA
jgi:hypothetical protein